MLRPRTVRQTDCCRGQQGECKKKQWRPHADTEQLETNCPFRISGGSVRGLGRVPRFPRFSPLVREALRCLHVSMTIVRMRVLAGSRAGEDVVNREYGEEYGQSLSRWTQVLPRGPRTVGPALSGCGKVLELGRGRRCSLELMPIALSLCLQAVLDRQACRRRSTLGCLLLSILTVRAAGCVVSAGEPNSGSVLSSASSPASVAGRTIAVPKDR
jgi:hypothetical protein